MLNQSFKSRLSKLSSKKEEDQVVQEFVLTYVSIETVQLFLQSLDEAYELSLRHPFISNNIDWKKISYDVRIPFLKVEFDALKMNATLVGINVTRKVLKDHEEFKYELIFHKQHDPEIDSVFAITYLNRKEENEKGKKVFLEYETNISMINRPASEKEGDEEAPEAVVEKKSEPESVPPEPEEKESEQQEKFPEIESDNSDQGETSDTFKKSDSDEDKTDENKTDLEEDFLDFFGDD